MSNENTPAEQAAVGEGGLSLKQPVVLPDVLDLLIVGGGPMGTAAAFRAKELGLAALVIDHDDILKRIRDYSKDKLILPDYGGGDLMTFPEGGELTRALHFEPIDKDDLCRRWKALYREHSVPAQTGVELTGVKRSGDVWVATVMNHNLKREQELKARHVAIGVGRGVPRQLEVQGDLSGLSFALSDATRYVGSPACVIGGGTSAAEAVIAISNAKAAAADPSGVFWSNRGQKMPKVSSALAGVFFEAFVGHGNIKYLPTSEPVSTSGCGPQGTLAIRIERSTVAPQPTTVTMLEFLKTSCVACIGEDLPESLLNRLGVPLVEVEAGRKRVRVTPVMETVQTDMYLAGDTLSPLYLECVAFDDPEQQKEVRRRGNIKAAMRDGVLVAEVVAQKLAGRETIRVQLNEPAASLDETVHRKPGPLTPPKMATATRRLVSILPTGVEAAEFTVKPEGVTSIGRQATDIAFPLDDLLSDRHAEISATPQGYVVRDTGSTSGTFLKPSPEHSVAVKVPALVMVGQQWLVVGSEGRPEVIHYEQSGREMGRFPLVEGTTIVGRESGGVSIAPDDKSLSRRHLSILRKDGQFSIRDFGTPNGTFIRVDSEVPIENDDYLLLGQQTLRFISEELEVVPSQNIEYTITANRLTTKPGSGAAAAEGKAPVPAEAPAPDAPEVTEPSPAVLFAGASGLLPCDKNATILDVAEKNNIPIQWDCRKGRCGYCPILVQDGTAYLNPMTRAERDTLEELCQLDPATHRLACVTRTNGTVTVKIIPQ